MLMWSAKRQITTSLHKLKLIPYRTGSRIEREFKLNAFRAFVLTFGRLAFLHSCILAFLHFEIENRRRPRNNMSVENKAAGFQIMATGQVESGDFGGVDNLYCKYSYLIGKDWRIIQVSFQNKQKFWEGRTIRPDLVITKKQDGESDTYVIDTKWKVLDVKNPKPSDDDLKQMYAYNLYWNANKSMLLYPSSRKVEERFGNYWKGREINELNQCKIGFADILDENLQLNFDVGNQILSKLF